MKRRAFMGLGLASIGAGALYRTSAFSSLSAGRGVAVSAADDRHGLLGIENLDTSDDPEFTNNTSQNMKVELADIDSGTRVTFTESEIALSSKERRTIAVETDDNAESAEVEITAKLFEGGNAGDLFENGTKSGQITMQRDFSVPLSEFVDFTGEADSSGNKGDFSFILKNTGTIDVPLTGIGINATSTNATEVSQRGGAVLTVANDNLVTTAIPIDSTNPDNNTRRDFEYDLPAGEESNFELYRFKRNGKKVGMKNANIRVSIYFEGNSDPKTFDLCLNSGSCGDY